MKEPKWKLEGWHDAGNSQCVCPFCGHILSTNSLGRDAHKKSCWVKSTVRLDDDKIQEIIAENRRSKPVVDPDDAPAARIWQGYQIFNEITILDRKQNAAGEFVDDVREESGYSILTPDGRELFDTDGIVFQHMRSAMGAAKADATKQRGEAT